MQGEDLERFSKIVVPKGGAVEVVNSLAVLVVSRYWVLAMGLLGRYRSPEVVSWPPPQGGQDPVRTVTQLEDQIYLGEGSMSYGGGDSHSLSDISLPTANRTLESVQQPQLQQTQQAANQPIELKKYRAIRGRHGTWELSGTRRPEVQGFTGSFLSLGRQKGIWNYQSLVAFQTRSKTEIREMLGMEQRISRKEEASSLRTLLCLAHGLLPCWLDENVISVLDPVSEGFYTKSREFLTESGRRRRSNHHRRLVLRMASTVPSVLATSAASFGISNLRVNEWAPFSPPPAPVDNDGNPHRNNNQHPPPNRNNNNDRNHPLNNEEGENPSWYIVPGSGKQLRLDDVFKLLLSFFSLDWDEWG